MMLRARPSLITLLLYVQSSWLVFAILPPTITLQGLVRDFSNYHVDFESPVDSKCEQPRLFLPELTNFPDSRPVFMPPALRSDDTLGVFVGTTCSIAGAQPANTKYAISNFGRAFHDEYYQDVPGVNIAIPIDLTLDLIDPSLGIYGFSSDTFFPINDLGYVRERLDMAPLNAQVNRENNYWFTTEIRIQFYYRKGQIFNFTGDDDLWVFINDKLTPCDLGGIHVARTCFIKLDELDLLENSTYNMAIFHAERHYRGSSFAITTSIVPENQAPIVAASTTIVLNENTDVLFQLQGYDPDYNPNLKFMVLSKPQRGQLSIEPFIWIPYESKLKYTPEQGFNGKDSFEYLLSDNFLNSTIGKTVFVVRPVNTPPVPNNASITAQIGKITEIVLTSNDADTSVQDLTYYLLTVPKYGYADLTTSGLFKYQAVNKGKETLMFQVFDGTFYATGVIHVDAVDSGNGEPGKVGSLKTGQFIGVLLGAIALCSFLGCILAYFIYMKMAANKFEKTWKKEFLNARMVENKLFRPATKEHFNPLYSGR